MKLIKSILKMKDMTMAEKRVDNGGDNDKTEICEGG